MRPDLINGNAQAIALADGVVQVVVTSPPYWGLRDYGIDGQLGLEDTIDQFVENLIGVFREIWRVLRDDGTVWLNLGDSYASGWSCNRRNIIGNKSAPLSERSNRLSGQLKEKYLCGIPWRVALALQADGWYLRSEIIWHKSNPMPESVTDRPSRSHEQLFLLTKRAHYFYDGYAVREPSTEHPADWRNGKPKRFNMKRKEFGGKSRSMPGREAFRTISKTRNRRTVWEIATAPYKGAHFATYPPALVEPCVAAGSSERGACPECRAPWKRRTLKKFIPQPDVSPERVDHRGKIYEHPLTGKAKYNDVPRGTNEIITIGWEPTCGCWGDLSPPDLPRARKARKRAQQDARGDWVYRAVCYSADTIPCIVLDPFVGSGTTLQVARAASRHGVGIDLSESYLNLAKKRLSLEALDAWQSGRKPLRESDLSGLPMFEMEQKDNAEI